MLFDAEGTHKGKMANFKVALLTVLIAVSSSLVEAQTETCVSIPSSKECSAFTPFSVSTDNFLVGLYPFLRNVNDAATFDTQLSSYINTSYVHLKYQTLFGCGGVLLTNTTDLYARYTTSVVCNGIIQNSKERCSLSAANSRPLCANSCADQALSESVITSNPALCLDPSNYTDTQIRADFTTCALPADSLQNSDCIQGSINEPDNCGFGGSTLGLCTYCSQSSDDTCCSSSQSRSRCANIAVPSSISSISLPTGTASIASSSTSQGSQSTISSSSSRQSTTSNDSSHGTSGTTIAVIVVGCVVGVVLLGLLIFFVVCCGRKRRRRQDQTAVIGVHEKKEEVEADRESDASSGRRTSILRPQGPTSDYTVLPGGRIARKAILAKPTVVVPSRIVPRSTQRNVTTKEPVSETQARVHTPPREDLNTSKIALPQDNKARNSAMAEPLPSLSSTSHPDGLAINPLSERKVTVPTSNEEAPTSYHTPIPRDTHVPASVVSSTAVALTTNPATDNSEEPPLEEPPPEDQARAPTPPRKDSTEYTVLPGGRMVRTTAVSPAPVENNTYIDQPRLSRNPGSDNPPERRSHISPEPQNPPNQGQLQSIGNAPQDQKDTVQSARSVVGLNNLFPYPLALLLRKNSGTSAASSNADVTPSLGPADLSNYELLPGGRLVRKYVPKPSPDSSSEASRPPSPRRSQPLQSDQPNKNNKPVEKYQQLPGGRMVRTTALENHMHNQGLKPSSKGPMLGTAGAAAIASAARLRESDERSRAGTPPPTPPTGQRASISSELQRDSAVAKEDCKKRSRNSSSAAQSPPPSPTAEKSSSQEDEALQPENPPAVPSFKDAFSDSVFTAGSLVAAVWSYQPQTQDEFALERGDMLEIVSVWNDGWATGRFSPDRIDAWEAKHGILIDTDLIDLDAGSPAGRPKLHRAQTTMVKAFPLVCVCAPRYWRAAVRDA